MQRLGIRKEVKPGFTVYLFRLFLCILWLLIPWHSCEAGPFFDQLKFTHYSSNEGLSQNSVYSIIQDSKGFIWIGTQDGLNRYDGYQFKIYRHTDDEKNGISDSFVIHIFEASNGIMWLSTASGDVNLFNPETETFSVFDWSQSGLEKSPGLAEAFYEDSEKTIWIGYRNGELIRFSQKTGKSEWIKTLSGQLEHIDSIGQQNGKKLWIGSVDGLKLFNTETERLENYSCEKPIKGFVTDIYKDNNKSVWIASEFGKLSVFSPETGELKQVLDLKSTVINKITSEESGILWLATFDGLFRYTPTTGHLLRYSHNVYVPYTLKTNGILSVLIDRSGVLWAGSNGQGLSKCTSKDHSFIHIHASPGIKNSLSSNMIFSIIEDRDNHLWVGTGENGLNIIDKKSGVNQILRDISQDKQKSISGNFVGCLYEDTSGNVWAGTRGGGLNKYNRKTGSHSYYLHNPANPDSISSNNLYCIFESIHHPDMLWMGTLEGLDVLDTRSGKFRHFKWEYSGEHVGVKAISEDEEGFFWLATLEHGLMRFESATGKTVNYRYIKGNSNSLGSDTVFCLYEEGDDFLWIGTSGGGLNRFNKKTLNFKRYTVKDGLPNNSVYAILADREGFLWMSTNRGLSRFDRKNETFVNFGIEEGLQHSEFNSGAYFQDRNGMMYFGGINGLTVFHPVNIHQNTVAPDIVITDFSVNNRKISPAPDSMLEKSIHSTDSIQLSYKQNFITFSFVATDYRNPEKNCFKYMLEGYDENWHICESGDRTAEYTGVKPGDYIFKVMGSNNDGVWSTEAAEIRISIIPPFWTTNWFKTLLLLTMGLSAFFLHKLRTAAIRKNNQALTRANEALNNEIENRKKVELSLAKSEEKFRNMIEQSPFSTVIFNTDGSVFKVNQSFVELWNVGSDCEYIMENYNINEDEQYKTANLTSYIQRGFGGEIVTFPVIRYSPSGMVGYKKISVAFDAWIINHMYPVRNESGELVKVVMVQEDVSEKKLAEDDQKRLMGAIEQTEEMIVIMDSSKKIKYINSAYEKMTGHRRVVMFGEYFENISSGLHEMGYYTDIFNQLDAGKNWTGKLAFRRKSGDVFDAETSISPIKDSDGKISNYVAVLRDTSELKKLEKQVRQSQKMEAIGTLAGGIAHDFNNILAPILGYSELLLDSVSEDNHETREGLSMIMKSTCRARDLIKQILTFSRKGEQEKLHMQLKTIAQEALDLIRATIPVSINIEKNFERSDYLIHADPVQIHQVIMNLCTNAYHAMRETGGTISVSIKDFVVSADDTVLGLEPGRYKLLAVTDTGSGIDKEHLDKIFDPFFTTKDKGEGTGLGLSTVHGIIKDHGGKISVYSEKESGTTFKIYFPVIKNGNKEELPEFKELPRGHECILFVDDELDIVKMQTTALESLGYKVISADSSEKAFRLFKSNLDNIDMVITDMSMPFLSGKELTRLLRNERKGIPIILTTGFMDQRNVLFVKESGVSDVLMKPVLRLNLAVAIRKALDN